MKYNGGRVDELMHFKAKAESFAEKQGEHEGDTGAIPTLEDVLSRLDLVEADMSDYEAFSAQLQGA